MNNTLIFSLSFTPEKMQNVVLGFLNFGIGKPTLKNEKSDPRSGRRRAEGTEGDPTIPTKRKLIKIKPLVETDRPLADRLETAMNSFLSFDKYEPTITIRLSHLETVRLPLGFRERAAKLVKRKKLHLIIITSGAGGTGEHAGDTQFSSPTTLVMKWKDIPEGEELVSLWASIRNLHSLSKQ